MKFALWQYAVHALAYGFGLGLAIMADDIIAGIDTLAIVHMVRLALRHDRG